MPQKTAKSVKEMIESDEMVKVVLPEDPQRPDSCAEIGLNGVVYTVPRGVEVEIPKCIYNVFLYSHQKTIQAMKDAGANMRKEIVIS